MSTLAIHGGDPSITTQAPHYIWPPITDRTREAVLRQLESGISIYNRSGIIETLEERLAQYYGVRYAVLTNSGTAALHSLYTACGIGEGDEVLCPAYTFFATVTPLLFLGATPILVDCDENGNLDPLDARNKITPRTKALVVTHMWGMPCDMQPIQALALEHGFLLLEDTSHAHGARYRGQLVGTFGNGAAMSLQGQKTLTGGEGGVLLTNNEEIYYRTLLFGHYNKRCKDEIPRSHPLYPYAVTGMGLKLRIHPLAAAIANEQLDGLDDLIDYRRRVAHRMQDVFGEMPGLQVPRTADGVEPSWYAFVMQYGGTQTEGLTLDRLYEALKAEGCKELDRPGSTCPLHHHRLFQDPGGLFPRLQILPDQKAPRADVYHAHALKLPVWHEEAGAHLMEAYGRAFWKVYHNLAALT